MPDLLNVFANRWKFILGVTLVAGIVAFILSAVSPDKYLATATALPANSLVADKARIYNSNIEALYSDFGTPDELDRLEGTGMLDTIFIATANDLNLPQHYKLGNSGESMFKAAMELKDETRISRSPYGELKIKVWDKERNMTAAMANTLLEKIQELHQRLQNESNIMMLKRLQQDQDSKKQQYREITDSLSRASGADADILNARKSSLLDQMMQYEKMIDQYQLAINSNPKVLLTVEQARAPLWPDKPKVMVTVLLVLFAAFIFSFLISVFIESRKS